MTHPVAVLDPRFAAQIDPDTLTPFADAAYFAWRIPADRSLLDITNGLYWTADGRRVLSLATGTALHGWGGVDYETYPIKGYPGDDDDEADRDICCHPSQAEADRCAVIFLITGRLCGGDNPIDREDPTP